MLNFRTVLSPLLCVSVAALWARPHLLQPRSAGSGGRLCTIAVRRAEMAPRVPPRTESDLNCSELFRNRRQRRRYPIEKKWLAALDDFRNWLIREAA